MSYCNKVAYSAFALLLAGWSSASDATSYVLNVNLTTADIFYSTSQSVYYAANFSPINLQVGDSISYNITFDGAPIILPTPPVIDPMHWWYGVSLALMGEQLPLDGPVISGPTTMVLNGLSGPAVQPLVIGEPLVSTDYFSYLQPGFSIVGLNFANGVGSVSITGLSGVQTLATIDNSVVHWNGFPSFATGGGSYDSVSIGSLIFGAADGQFYQPPAAVPEPSSWAMAIIGFGIIGTAMRKRQRARVSFA